MKIPPYVEEKIGKKFGMLTVVSFLRRESSHQGHRYIVTCLCDCGNERIMRVDSLPRAKSCGCLKHPKTSSWHSKNRLHLKGS